MRITRYHVGLVLGAVAGILSLWVPVEIVQTWPVVERIGPWFAVVLGWFFGVLPLTWGERLCERVEDWCDHRNQSQPATDTRGALHLADVWLTLLTVVTIVVTAPIWYKFVGMVSAPAGPFSGLLLQLVMPLLVLALILGVGVSARRAG